LNGLWVERICPCGEGYAHGGSTVLFGADEFISRMVRSLSMLTADIEKYRRPIYHEHANVGQVAQRYVGVGGESGGLLLEAVYLISIDVVHADFETL
jgi:hypothetical protein